MLPGLFMLAAQSSEVITNAPDGPPTDVEIYFYAGGAKYGVQWVNGDTTDVVTDISLDGGSTIEHTVSAGVTSKDIGYTPTTGEEAVRHRSSGGVTEWVSATPA